MNNKNIKNAKLFNSIMKNIKNVLYESLDDTEDSEYIFKNFYDDHCKMIYNNKEYFIYFDVHYINTNDKFDFDFDNLTITEICNYEGFNSVSAKDLDKDYIADILMNNYYDEIQKGLIQAYGEDMEADAYISNNDEFDIY